MLSVQTVHCVEHIRDHFVNTPRQWEMMLQYNIIPHWQGTFTKWSLICDYAFCLVHWNISILILINISQFVSTVAEHCWESVIGLLSYPYSLLPAAGVGGDHGSPDIGLCCHLHSVVATCGHSYWVAISLPLPPPWGAVVNLVLWTSVWRNLAEITDPVLYYGDRYTESGCLLIMQPMHITITVPWVFIRCVWIYRKYLSIWHIQCCI